MCGSSSHYLLVLFHWCFSRCCLVIFNSSGWSKLCRIYLLRCGSFYNHLYICNCSSLEKFVCHLSFTLCYHLKVEHFESRNAIYCIKSIVWKVAYEIPDQRKTHQGAACSQHIDIFQFAQTVVRQDHRLEFGADFCEVQIDC